MNKIHDHLTPGRRRWLEKLERDGMGHRPRGPQGYQCMVLGWTEWVYEDVDGNRMTGASAKEKFGNDYLRRVRMVGETLTDAGRQKLREAPHG